MKKQKNRLAIDFETLKPLVLDRVTGGGIGELTTVTTATTATTMFQTRWCKPGGK